jgi:Fuc2NAc and GlcNAc transferase
VIFLLSLIAGIAGAWVVAKHGHILGLLDEPTDRSSHSKATPKGGGIGILVAFIIAAIGLNLNLLILLPAGILSLSSFYGDRLHISPKIRLLLQFLCAGITVWATSRIFSGINIYLTVFFVFFIVATANYYNFMDGINGIAGITGIIGFGILAYYTWNSNPGISYLCLCMAIGCLGFLPFNLPGAKVFMGDVGSILLGFVFAVVVMLVSDSLTSFVCLASFIFPFYADEFISVLLRIKQRKNLLTPHRGHLYQLIANELKVEHWKVSAAYGTVQLIIAAGSLYLAKINLIYLVLWLCFALSVFALAYYIVMKKVTQAGAVKG